MKCGGALWGRERTRTHTHAHKHVSEGGEKKAHQPHQQPPPFATAAVLQEAAVPLADQILSVTFPLINGHLLPPFSLHGYTLSLRRSNHLIVMTFNLIRAGAPQSAAVLAGPPLTPATLLPATHQLGRHEGRKNKPTNQPCANVQDRSHKQHLRN